MVRLTMDIIARGTSGYTKKKRDESIQHYLRRLTHLYLEDRNIDEVTDDISLCRNLVVLYLYDNSLSRIPQLAHNANLTHLYLQNNHIARVENLAGLHKLTKLYLGGNNINVLEGIEKMALLQELHIENQRLPPGEKLLFDPRSISSLANTLQVFNISGNRLDSIRDVQPLTRLTQFMASDNKLRDLRELAHCMAAWRNLWRLDLQGNPLCHKAKYRDRVIVMAPSLETLDGKEVTETAKQFLQKWQANKDAVKRRRESAVTREGSQLHDNLSGEKGDGGLSKRTSSTPGYIMPALPRKQFQDVLARSTSLSDATAENGTHQTEGSQLHRAYSVGATKYLNTYGTIYHDHQKPTNSKSASARPTMVSLGADYSVGDGMPVPETRT